MDKCIFVYLWLFVMLLRKSLGETVEERWPPGFTHISYETIIPMKLTPKSGLKEPEHISYLLQIGGNNQVVHLRQKWGLVPKHFPVFYYNEEGDLQMDQPFIRDDCFYHGFFQDKPSSLVTLSFCSGGLRGILQLENKTYEIEPVEESAIFQHVVYSLEEEQGAVSMRCGLTKEEEWNQKAIMPKMESLQDRSASKWWPHTRYAEIAFVIDYERYLKFNRNKTLVAMNVMDILHIANSLYEPLSVKLSLAGLEIWTKKNPIKLHWDIRRTLRSFTKWRRDSLQKRLRNDAAHLFAFKHFSDLGLAYTGGICRDDYGSAVEQYVTTRLFTISFIFTHELGHNLGMSHDKKYCSCDKVACIMAEFRSGYHKFSNCSYRDYFKNRNAKCLLELQDPSKTYTIKFCGNKIVDDGEQCDCGSAAQCKSDPCCLSNCMLRPGATCTFGLCCDKCQYRVAGTVCRAKTSSCDLPEYCNGTSERCPEDVHVLDGVPCSDGAYCYNGNCNTHDKQCKTIFGSKAIAASDVCFQEMNTKGDRFGNCGLKYKNYKKCKVENILCGRIQCENVKKLPSLEEHSTIIQFSIGNKQCWGIDYHIGSEIMDLGAVKDSTPCGRGRICIHQKCVSVTSLMDDCNVTKCHNRGVCNSRKHCHCDYGWKPPNCQYQGHGGSIDSGPPSQLYVGKHFAKARVIGGLTYGLCGAAIFVGVVVHFRNRLINKLRKLGGKIHPTESIEGEYQQ
ncbi:disintegrin and metalloproteinase domain-containing protein 20-like [Protobothrops mucrosquamatus]|uniref:disintegrin and metalloproteinase domain-containing protein 20-like n=1 Tax=Protobothrops mucrosquamatus TaxID=103944 RepID=UPI0007756569|nr:disintegrin and metalloproteinase domain-containing protein 20-like [Protobothrops mucrosquamatus]